MSFTEFNNSCLVFFSWIEDFKYFWRKLIPQRSSHVLGLTLDLSLVAALVIPFSPCPPPPMGNLVKSILVKRILLESQRKCLQFVTLKAAKLLKSLLQFDTWNTWFFILAECVIPPLKFLFVSLILLTAEPLRVNG